MSEWTNLKQRVKGEVDRYKYCWMFPGMTWLHALHIAICYAERGDVEYPLQLLQQSFDLKVGVCTVHSYRLSYIHSVYIYIHTYIHSYVRPTLLLLGVWRCCRSLRTRRGRSTNRFQRSHRIFRTYTLFDICTNATIYVYCMYVGMG